jgi:hypothetical protein
MAIPNELVNDADYPIIPKAHRNVLKNKALLMLLGLNNGIGIEKELILSEYIDELNKMKTACLPYEQQSLSVDVGGYTNIMEDQELDVPNTWR